LGHRVRAEWDVSTAAALCYLVAWLVAATASGATRAAAIAAMLMITAGMLVVTWRKPRTRRGSRLVEALIVVLPPLLLVRSLTRIVLSPVRSPFRAAEEVLVGALAATGLLVLFGALTVWGVEHDLPEASIDTLQDALWWAAVSVTTVGYGDVVPVTALGRVVGVVMIFLGVLLIAAVTSFVTVRLVRPEDRFHPTADATRTAPDAPPTTPADVAALHARLDGIEAALARLADHVPPVAAGAPDETQASAEPGDRRDAEAN
jgi:voltage-gated potassium channel